jgi:hypothetical protein
MVISGWLFLHGCSDNKTINFPKKLSWRSVCVVPCCRPVDLAVRVRMRMARGNTGVLCDDVGADVRVFVCSTVASDCGCVFILFSIVINYCSLFL